MIDRKTYWCYVATYFTFWIVVGIVIGFAPDLISEEVYRVANYSAAIWWYIGYWRCKDAGVHGGWAIFTPMLVGMVWIGCLKSKPAALVIDDGEKQAAALSEIDR